MVLLPCPRLQRGTDHSSDQDDSSLSDRTGLETLPRSPDGQLDEERQELADIFHPSTPQSDSRIRVPFRSKSSPSRVSSTQPRAVGQKKSRVSLISLPSKLRRRLSRDARLSKKTSGLPVAQSQTPSVDIFGNSRGSDCGYDSDAYCILTPQISRGLDGSPFSVRLNQAKGPIPPPGIIQDNPMTVPIAPGGTADGESNNLEHIDPVPKSGDADGTPHQTTTSREERPRGCTPRANEDSIDRTGCLTPADSFMEDQAFFTPPDGQSPAGLAGDVRAASIRETFNCDNPSPLWKDNDRVRLQLPKDNPETGGSSRSPERSPPPIPCRHPLREESPCSDLRKPSGLSRTALDYRSQSAYSDDAAGYKPAAQSQSQICPQQERSQFNRSVSSSSCKGSVLRQPTRLLAGCNKAETDRIQEDTVALRDFEAQIKSSRTSLLLEPNSLHQGSRTNSQGRLQVAKRKNTPLAASRFVENFEDLPTDNGSQTQPSSDNRREHRTSSEGWLSGGRRQGFGYNFVADVERGTMAKAAVEQPHEVTHGERQESAGGFSAAKKDHKESGIGEFTGAMAAGHDSACNRASGEELPVRLISDFESTETKVAQMRRSLSITSWAKSPFSALKGRLSLDVGLEKTEGERKRDTRSVTPAAEVESVSTGLKSRGLFKPWTRLSRSNSVMKKHGGQYHGKIAGTITQSINASFDTPNNTPTQRRDPLGVLEELSESKNNIKQSPRQPVSPLRNTSDGGPGRYDGPSDADFQPAVSRGTDQVDTRSVSEISSAEVWSQMYQNCLPHLSISEETDASLAVRNGVSAMVKGKD